MSLADKIKALPGWPLEIERDGPYRVYKDHKYTAYDDGNSAETPYQTDLADAALARLALAREAIAELRDWLATLPPDCPTSPCIAELDALLAALKLPEEK